MKQVLFFCIFLCASLVLQAQVNPKIQPQPVKTKIIPAARVPAVRTKATELTIQTRQLTDSIQVFKAMVESMKSDLDSMSEMGETESLRLQTAMDRMNKMMTTLSNLMKKISDTQTSITQNIK